MKTRIWIAVAVWGMVGATDVRSDTIGEVIPVTLTSGSATMRLDFTDRDYELVLYPRVMKDPDASLRFTYTVSGASLAPSSKPAQRASLVGSTDRELCVHFKEYAQGPFAARKQVLQLPPPPNIGSTRTFGFKMDGVAPDLSVTATLVAIEGRILAYRDNTAGSGGITDQNIQEISREFNVSTYDLVTNTFGRPSDVDRDGRIIFLFTPLVDTIGVGAFFLANALKDPPVGSKADMLFFSLSRSLSSYQMDAAHEFQHLINYNEHVIESPGRREETWLDEALSQVAEDLVAGRVLRGNWRRIQDLMEDTSAENLTRDKADGNPDIGGLRSGERGAAHLFLRHMIDVYGDGVLKSLAQTTNTGIINVETVTGTSFPRLFEDYALRLFLSRTGLNSDPRFNYTFVGFFDTVSSTRTLLFPKDRVLSAGSGRSFTGTVKPAAVAYLRLTGRGSAEPAQISISTELAGSFEAFLIALPIAYEPELSLPEGFFESVVLDRPLPTTYFSGQTETLSGSVRDSKINRIAIRFRTAASDVPKYFNVSDGRFSFENQFSSQPAGTYTFSFHGGQQSDASLPSLGRYSPVRVLQSQPDIAVDLAMIDFGEVDIGQQPTVTRAITNRGTEALEVTLTSNNASFNLSDESLTLAPGSSANITITFAPSSTGVIEGELAITSNDPDESVLPISIRGRSGKAKIRVTAPAPLSVAWGSGAVNTPHDTIVTVSNTGTDTLFVTALTITGTNSDQFSVVGATLPDTVLVGETQNYTVQFAPTSVGDKSASLAIENNTGTPATMGLSGTGIGVEAISVSSSSIEYGNVSVGGSADLTLTVSNTGTDTLFVTVITEVGADTSQFSLMGATLPDTVLVRGTQDYKVWFIPTSVGDKRASLFIVNSTNAPVTVELRGTGTGMEAIRVTAPAQLPVAWGSRAVNTQHDTTVTVHNPGTDTLFVTAIIPAGADASQFSVVETTFPDMVLAGETQDYTVRFAPTSVGNKNASLAIENSTGTPATVGLSGRGTLFTEVPGAAHLIGSDNSQSAAWGDYDNDGDLDLYVVNAGSAGSTSAKNKLYRNKGPSADGTWTFELAGGNAGVGVEDTGDGRGAAWGDYDNDGDLDLYVVNNGENRLYHNNGDRSFTEVGEYVRVKDNGDGWGAAWGDYDNDGDLDLYVVNARSADTAPNNKLYRNEGPSADGTWIFTLTDAGVSDPGEGRGQPGGITTTTGTWTSTWSIIIMRRAICTATEGRQKTGSSHSWRPVSLTMRLTTGHFFNAF